MDQTSNHHGDPQLDANLDDDVCDSPDPPSTRPNPFDDGDISARKRRRTSGSQSPGPRHESMEPHKSHARTPDDDRSAAHTTAAMIWDHDDSTEIPKTPKKPSPSPVGSSTPLSSSKVTLNIRKANEPQSSELSSPSPHHKRGGSTQPPAPGRTVKSGGASKSAGTEDGQPDYRTPNSSQPSSASPPVELVAISDDEIEQDDDRMSFSVDDRALGSIDSDRTLLDPTGQFPYTELDEDPLEALQRLLQFLITVFTKETESSINTTILNHLNEWMDSYLDFSSRTDVLTVLDSRLGYRSFWFTLPDAFLALSTRLPEFATQPPLRDRILAVFAAYARLTACMVSLDTTMLREMHTAINAEDQPCPEVFSTRYMRQLHNLLEVNNSPTAFIESGISASGLNRDDVSSYLLIKFQTSHGGTIDCLAQLVACLKPFLSDFPRLLESVSSVSHLLTDCLAELLRTALLTEEDVESVQRQMQLAHGSWTNISQSLDLAMDKHITQISTDTAIALIQSLTDMLKCVLRSEHRQALEVKRAFQQKHTEFPYRFSIDAIALEWKFGVLECLIQSSQMQLRVLGTTTLCSDLVSMWKNCGDSDDESAIAFLEHIGSYLQETDLIDYILGPNCHPEIIVESANILGFLVITNTCQQGHIDRLWQGMTMNQNPRLAAALAKMLTSITSLFDYEGLVDLCEKFQELQLEAFTPNIRTLWGELTRQLVAKCRKESLETPLCAYRMSLSLLRQSSICAPGTQIADPEMHLAAIHKLRELFSRDVDDKVRKDLFLNCLNDIASNSATTLGSLWCLSMGIRHDVSNEIQLLTQHHNLSKLLVEELSHATRVGNDVGVVAVLSGSANQPRREMISHVIQLRPDSVNNELGMKLLDMLVGPQSPCFEDRHVGWQVILNLSRKLSLKNAFLHTCFSEYLPQLPVPCFSAGMLEFVREQTLSLAQDSKDLDLDDASLPTRIGIDQLWRIILESPDSLLVSHAVSTLAVDVYLESNTIISCSLSQSRHIHASLVTRCFGHMEKASKRINGGTDESVGDYIDNDDGESMVIVATDEEMKQQVLVFRRSLQLLRFFLEKHQTHPSFAVADIRPLMDKTPAQIQGDLTDLKYQGFDGLEQTNVKPLSIGRQNTFGSLLACLRDLTGFSNYRIYYRGRQLLPTAEQVRLSLEQLCVCDGLVLVKREDQCEALEEHVKPGSSALEIEILSHFQDLWEYLGMDDGISMEIYDFLVKLPPDGRFSAMFDSDTTSYRDLFLRGQPFKTLYAIHALRDYIDASLQIHTQQKLPYGGGVLSDQAEQAALRRSLHLTVKALSDKDILGGYPMSLQLTVANALVQLFSKLFTVYAQIATNNTLDDELIPSPRCLVEILSTAMQNDEEASGPLIHSTCQAILFVGSASETYWGAVADETSFLEYVQTFLLKDSRIVVRQTIVELIEDCLGMQSHLPTPDGSNSSDIDQKSADHMFPQLCSSIIDILPETVNFRSQSIEFFEVLHWLLQQSAPRLQASIDIELLARETTELLLRHRPIETLCEPHVVDHVVSGLSLVLHTCLQLDETLPNRESLPGTIASGLFMRHLFPHKRQGRSAEAPCVVVNSNTRQRLYDIVVAFARQDVDEFAYILESLDGLVPFYIDEPDDPYLYELPCQFDRARATRAPCGYVGLRNLSNTCYLNSLLTQLFMNTGFRQFILSLDVEDADSAQRLLFYTQKLFGYMQESWQRFVDPAGLVHSIKTYDDTLIDVHNQMDVDEFYNLLFDRWEGQLKHEGEKEELRSFFGGQLVQQIKSKECEHISERLEPFSAIQCDIKGKNTLSDSLQAYVDGEVMEGENKYKCSTCNRHVDAVKRACLKDLPDNLIFHLKRFDFNLRTLQRSKINDYFSFPDSIDLAPYTVEHLTNPDKQEQPDIFELVGVLVHSGTAETGHYYSYIRERSSLNPCSWVEFNDDSVTPWNPALMEASTFGGIDHQIAPDEDSVPYDKTYSAYMLFYQRATSLSSKENLMVEDSVAKPRSVQLPPNLMEHIASANTLILKKHCLFDHDHLLFVQRCFSLAHVLGDAELSKEPSSPGTHMEGLDSITVPHRLQNMAMQMFLSHFDQVVTRFKGTPLLMAYSALLNSAVNECPTCALAYFAYFHKRHPVLRALLQRNPDQDVKFVSSQLIMLAAEKIRACLPDHYYGRLSGAISGSGSETEEWSVKAPHSVLLGLVGIFNYLWKFFHIHIRSWDEYFGAMLTFARFGAAEVGSLLAENYLLKLLHIITADPATEMPPNYTRMLANLLKRFNNKPANFVTILALIDHLMSRLESKLGAEVIVDDCQDRRAIDGKFPWTSDEVQTLCHHPDQVNSSFFIEKLLDLAQAQDITNNIIGRLVQTGDELDIRTYNALCRKIQGETSTQPMDSFLGVAGRYIECSESRERVQALIRHVCVQARNLQHTEGAAFLEFVNVVLRSSRPDDESAEIRRNYGIQVLPLWAPFLLVYGDDGIRNDAEQLIEDEVFRSFRESAMQALGEQEDEATPQHGIEDGVVRELGKKCVAYLRDVHVKRRVQIERVAAACICRVIKKCQPYYQSDDEGGSVDEDINDFESVEREVLVPLQRLIVDDVDDGSDWDESCESSELLEVNPGVTLHTTE